MAAPTTRAQFSDYCLRRLGHPVIQINVDEDQVSDRIDDALQFFYDYHFEGCEKIFMKHQITLDDIQRGWIYCPEAVIFVTQLMPFNNSNSSTNMFDLRYQLRLHDLYDFTSVSYVSYELTMQHITTLNMLFSGYPQLRFNRHQEKLFLDIDWTRDVLPGEFVVIECYRKLNPDTFRVGGTANTTTSSNTVIGTGTVFSRDILVGDEVTFGTETRRVSAIRSDTTLEVSSSFTANNTGVSMSRSGNSAVWNDRFLKQYATAMIKKQWGENMKKFGGIQMPGGVTLNGKEIWDEATEEIRMIEQEMQQYNVLPGDWIVG